MSEAALRQQIGGPEVLAEQLRHLSALITERSVTLDLRIVPFTATGNDAMGGANPPRVATIPHCVKVRFDGQNVLLGDTKHDHLGDDEPIIRLPFAMWHSTLAVVSANRVAR